MLSVQKWVSIPQRSLGLPGAMITSEAWLVLGQTLRFPETYVKCAQPVLSLRMPWVSVMRPQSLVYEWSERVVMLVWLFLVITPVVVVAPL